MPFPPATIDVMPTSSAPVRFKPSDAQRGDLLEYVMAEIDDSFAERTEWENECADCLRMYEAIPATERRNVPIPNAPNFEVPLGAIAADSIYAQSVDTIFQISPIVTVRATSPDFVEHAKALQRFVDWGQLNEWQLRPALMDALLDDIQLGTGVLYIPWLERRRKVNGRVRLTRQAPLIRAYPIEDFLTPGSAPSQISDMRWCGLRQFITATEFKLRAKTQRWDDDGATPAAATGIVHQQRERLAKTKPTGEAERVRYEVLELYVSYDIDGDDIPEDLLVTIDRSSRKMLRLAPDPFDRARPFESMVYQPRAHLFRGLGVMKMLKAFEAEATEVHVQRLLNMLLANCRMWIGKEGVISESMDVWPNRVITSPDPEHDLKGLELADVYPSSSVEENIILQYAERRSGVNDIMRGRGQQLGSRTPGITALSLIQNINQRFTPAFDGMRLAASAATRQCLYRYQERLLMGDSEVEKKLDRVLGVEAADLVIAVLRQESFDEALAIELTASTATTNRDADRQNSMMLVQFLGQYYEKLLVLMEVISNPQIPPAIRTTAQKIMDASAEAVDRTIRTFDTVRDPATFVLRLSDIFGANPPDANDQQISALLSTLAEKAGQLPAPTSLTPISGPGTLQ